jgi:hypothetical protein
MMEGDIIGFIASALVLATFAMTDMRRLRTTAIFSNLAFIAYGAFFELAPVLGLHLILLPLNIVRLVQEARRAPVAETPSKATLLAIEALHHSGEDSRRGNPQEAGRLRYGRGHRSRRRSDDIERVAPSERSSRPRAPISWRMKSPLSKQPPAPLW